MNIPELRDRVKTIRKTQWDSLKIFIEEGYCLGRKHKVLAGVTITALAIGFEFMAAHVIETIKSNPKSFAELVIKLIMG